MAPLSRGVMSVFCNVIKPQGLEPFQFSTKISSPSPFVHFLQEHVADSCVPFLPTWVMVDHDNDTMPLFKCGRVPLTEERPQELAASRRLSRIQPLFVSLA